MDWRGWVILAISLAVPFTLLLLRREKELLAWICLTVAVNVFDARVGLNLPAARLVGLLVLPYLPLGEFRLGELVRTKPFRILLAGFAYLAFLGVIYGYLYPWPDAGYLRPFVQTSPGRVMVYTVRLLSDFGIALFVARCVMRGVLPDEIIRYLLWGTSIAAAGGILEYLTDLQLYQLLTGFPINQVGGRARGFNFEPRGLGLAMVHGGFLAFLWSRYRRSRLLLLLAAAHFLVLVLAVSASALIAAAAAWACLVIFEPRTRGPLIGGALLAGAAVAMLVGLGKDLMVTQLWSINLAARFSFGDAIKVASQTPLENLAVFLDIFDYTAFRVLLSSPLAALIGTGPGLVMLPGSNFIPTDPRWSWVVETNEGITSPPTMGLLLEWSNGGILMVLLWLGFVVTCWQALSARAEQDEQHATSWRIGRAGFVMMAGTYLVQASPLSAMWPVFMGLGLGAAALGLRAGSKQTTEAIVAAQGAV